MVDGSTDGFPAGAGRYSNERIGEARWSIHRDFETPFAVIDRDKLEHNSRVMRRWIAEQGVELWPHAKTVMSPEIIDVELRDGATGMTVATVAQVRRMRDWGVAAVLLANQLVQRPAAVWVAKQVRDDPSFTFWSFVDSPEGVAVLQSAAEEAGSRFDVLVEVGIPGKRTGVRSLDQLDELLAAINAADRVRVLGVAAYEGAVAGNRGDAAMASVRGYLATVADFLRVLAERGALDVEVPVFSAGGSMFFDLVREAAAPLPFPTRLVVRAGCYVLHDHGLYERGTPLPDSADAEGLRGALTVWGTVHSRPEPTRAYLDVGRRDVSFDQGNPVPLRRLRRGSTSPEELHATVVSLNDHHAHLELAPETELEVGDRVELGISHPCTTMDKWRRIPVADPDGTVVAAVSTHF